MIAKRGALCLLLALVLLLLAGVAGAATVDPLLRGLARQTIAPSSGVGPLTLHYERIVATESDPRTGELRVGVILDLDGPLPDLSGVDGIVVGSTIGSVATARLPIRSLDALAAVPGIRTVRASTLSYPTLDMAIPDVKVNQVWAGSPAYTGSGVLVGVIDSGVDWTHDDYRHTDGTTRIKAIWDLFATSGGTPPAGFTSGVEYSESQINAALTGGGTVGEKDLNGHGTHVVGDAAGNGRASSGQYKGPAFEADIVFAKPFDDQGGGFPSDKTIDAMNYVVQKAQSLGKPVAINMSLGGHYGSHDGTDPQETVVNNLSGQGVVFCIAAGNEGADYLHDSGSASNANLVFRVLDGTSNQGANNDYALVIIWVDGATSPSVSVTAPNAGATPAVTGGQQQSFSSGDGVIIIDNATQGVDPNNGDKAIFIQLDDQSGTEVAAGDWTIHVTGGSGTADAWQVASSMVSGFINSDQSYSVGMPGTAEKAVTVAAYKSRNTWPSQNGTSTYSGDWGTSPVGDRAPFSSIGPTRDGRQKPDVAAPGMAIIAPYSKDETPPGDAGVLLPGGKYYATQGTSMATPITCGIAALLLEKNGSLTADQIRAALRNTARTDGFTGATWNARFGAGKVDALAALASVTAGGGTAATGDIDSDGGATVLDVVRLVNYILDPVGHALTTDQRNRADVFPAGGGDDVLNASDVARIIAFILKLDTPGAPNPGIAPSSVVVSAPEIAGDRVRVVVRVTGDELAAGQFALAMDGVTWLPEETRFGDPALGAPASRAVGSQLRVLFYDAAGRLPADGFTVVLTGRATGALSPPRIEGLLLADPYGFGRETRVQGAEAHLPAILTLAAAPNPMTASTTVHFSLAEPTAVRLTVFDVQGRAVRLLRDETFDAGSHEATWDGLDDAGRRVPAGVYLYRLATGSESRTQKLVIEG